MELPFGNFGNFILQCILWLWDSALAVTEFVSVHTHRFDNEIAIRQSVEADIAGLKKVIDDTNMSRINTENEIEAVREELMFLKKNHENVSLRSILAL